jgi:lysyl-tRNA synthetase class II
MIERKIFIFSLFTSLLFSGEISVSISEELVNDYLELIGDHEIPKGKKGDQATWTINEPHVRFQEGSAEFLAIVLYKKGKINIKKNVSKNMYVEYNYDDNIIQLMIDKPFIKMERKNETLGKLDLGSLYQDGLKFQGPRPKTQTIKLKTMKGRIRIDMNIKKSLIYFEPGVVRVAIDLDYK